MIDPATHPKPTVELPADDARRLAAQEALMARYPIMRCAWPLVVGIVDTVTPVLAQPVGGEWEWGVRLTWPDGTTRNVWLADETGARRVFADPYYQVIPATAGARRSLVRRWIGPEISVEDKTGDDRG